MITRYEYLYYFNKSEISFSRCFRLKDVIGRIHNDKLFIGKIYIDSGKSSVNSYLFIA